MNDVMRTNHRRAQTLIYKLDAANRQALNYLYGRGYAVGSWPTRLLLYFGILAPFSATGSCNGLLQRDFARCWRNEFSAAPDQFSPELVRTNLTYYESGPTPD